MYVQKLMPQSKELTSNLKVVKDICEELEGFYESFVMDKIWSKDKSRVTVCFTAEKIKAEYITNWV